MKKEKDILLYFMICVVAILSFASCAKLVEVDPPITSINGDNVFNESGNAIAVLTGIYATMSSSPVSTTTGRLTNICFTTGLAGDELKPFDPDHFVMKPYYENNIQTADVTWSDIYNMIFVANSAIEKLPQSTLIELPIRNQLLGEAKFIRALCYFYLVNLYGDVPLALSTDYKVNRILRRSDKSIIYQQIKSDLIEAKNLLSDDYLDQNLTKITTARIRPNKWTATALLSRVYLYTRDYINAEDQATEILSKTSLYKLVDINEVFLMNNMEAIWQLQPVGLPVDNTANTQEGRLFNLLPLPIGSYMVFLNEQLVNSFDPMDQRKIQWIGSVIKNGYVFYFPYKYKIGVENMPTKEYSTVMRLGEQYLIRAEARIKQGKIEEGIADLNRLRTRATDLAAPINNRLNQLPAGFSKDDALLAVERERRFELFTEWGHRWLDLKRTNRIDDVLMLVKPGYQTTDQLFPLPQLDISKNPNLVGHQNPGYQ